MRIDNGRYRKVTMDWTDITPPLKAGTPISLAGTISNDGDAIGIVPVTLMAQEFMPASIYILDAGDVSLEEAETESGLTIAESAKEALPAIHWHHADGTVDDYATGGGSGGSGGGVFLITETSTDDGSILSASYNDVVAALEAGKLPVIIHNSSLLHMTNLFYVARIEEEENEGEGYWLTASNLISGEQMIEYTATDPDDPLAASSGDEGDDDSNPK